MPLTYRTRFISWLLVFSCILLSCTNIPLIIALALFVLDTLFFIAFLILLIYRLIMLKYLAVAAAPLLLATLANAAPVDNIPTGDNFQLRGTARESFVRNGWRLIETSDQAPPSWLPPDQVQQLIYNHRGGFMDVTEDIMELNPAKKPKNLPRKLGLFFFIFFN